jgi:hypothetical protein
VDRHGFLPGAAAELIKKYKKTIAYAMLGEADKVGDSGSRPPQPDAPSASVLADLFGKRLPGVPVLGDWVQWESGGVIQFAEPKRVTGKSEDGAWIFVEGRPTGLSISEIQVVSPPAGAQKTSEMTPNFITDTPPSNPDFKPQGQIQTGEFKNYTMTLDTGDLFVRWPSKISEEDYEGAVAWLDGLKKKMKRSIEESDETQN